MIYYAIKNVEGKMYTSGYAPHNIKFSKNGKMFSSLKMIKSVINGMIREAIELDSRYSSNGIQLNLNEMKRYISTLTICEVESTEYDILTGTELMELNT